MKKLLCILLLFLSIHLSATEPLRIGVITDIHYLSEQLMDNGYSINSYTYETGKNVIAVPEVLDQVIAEYVDSDIEVLLISGDLTKDGEKQSHIEFKSKLKPLVDKGVKIFVVPGNHDINMPNSIRYQGNKTFDTENISPKQFEEIYADYGYKDAIVRDTNSLSYVAALNSSTWLLTLDVACYDEYKDKPTSAGRLKDGTKQWMLDVLQQAKDEGKQVIAMMHWGAVEHIPFQARFFPHYLVEDNKNIATLLADNGVKIVFTGHFHSNDITEFVSEKGYKIYDVETGALVSYPFAYRSVEVTKEQVKIETKNISSTPNHPKLAAESRENLKRIATTRALPMLKKMNFDFPENKQKQLAEIAGEFFVLHLLGDEKVNKEIRDQLLEIFIEMGFPIDDDINKVEIDLFPADNNVILNIAE